MADDQREGGEKVPPTILVVDDIPDNLVLISLALQGLGYRVVTATDGKEALRVALLARPDLIVMDIGMPHLDGLGATRQMRENSILKNIPIVALTAFTTDGFRQAAHDAGFDGYLTKPIDFERLNKLISGLLEDSINVSNNTGSEDR